MKQFKGTRNFDDILNKAKELEFKYYEQNHQQRFKKKNIDICLRSFGKFYVYDKKGNCIASEKSTELDDEQWYQEILEMFYKTAE